MNNTYGSLLDQSIIKDSPQNNKLFDQNQNLLFEHQNIRQNTTYKDGLASKDLEDIQFNDYGQTFQKKNEKSSSFNKVSKIDQKKQSQRYDQNNIEVLNLQKGKRNQKGQDFNVKDYVIPDNTVSKDMQYPEFMQKKILSKYNIDEQKRKHDQKVEGRKKGLFSEDDQNDLLKTKKRYTQEVQSFNFINEYIAGKVSNVWLFIINKINQEDLQKLKDLYKNISQKSYEVPLCRNLKQSIPYFEAQGSFFKVVVDLENCSQLLKIKYVDKIKQIYIFSNEGKSGRQKAVELKNLSRKIKAIYSNLVPMLKLAQVQIQDSNKFVRQNSDTIQQVKFRSKLPTFIKLSGQDKTQITKYRTCLYGSIKLKDQKQRIHKLDEFKEIVETSYCLEKEQLENLKRYLQINHIDCKPKNEKKHFDVLRFYVDETFYYKITNNILRICRTIDQFKPITIPFNQNYHAIKHFYRKMLAENDDFIPSYTLFRGAPIKIGDLKILKQGSYIQLLGFVSASKDQQYTRQNFLKRKGDYLFVIHINSAKVNQQTKKFDHGFVDLSKFKIAQPKFQAEQEVLLNALNVYKVLKVVTQQQSEEGVGQIHLQYGSILQLYQSKQNQLTSAQSSVLQNYRYCLKQLDQIDDLGDVLMKVQQFDKCKDFYREKLKQCKSANNYNKLAEVCYQCGQNDEARQNAIKSLQKYEIQIQKYKKIDKQTYIKIFKIHEKNAEILIDQEDSYYALKAINFEINLIDDQKDWFIKAQKLRQRGQVLFKQGKIIQSQKDLKQSQSIILRKKQSFDLKRNQIRNKYLFKYIIGCCCFSNQIEIQDQNIKQLQIVDIAERQVYLMNNKIQQLLLKINETIRSVAQFIGDKQAYQQCVQKGRQYFDQLVQNKSQDPFQRAKIMVIEAKIQNALKDIQNIQNSYSLMQQAIQLIQEVSPNNRKISDYRTLLGKFKQKQYNKILIIPKQIKQNVSNNNNPNLIKQTESNKAFFENQQSKFDYQEHQQKYEQVKNNFVKALEILIYNQTDDSPKVFQVRNYLGNLQYEHSNFPESKKQAQQVLETQKGPNHSEGAKSALLLAKIHLSRGQTKSSFKFIEQSHRILRKAIVKSEQNRIYIELYQQSPIYIEIELWRCKIYNRQLKHDLALNSIENLQIVAKRKLRNADGVGYLADIYQERGNILIYQKSNVQFEKYYQKSIKLRQNQMGKYNVLNGICLCTLFKYLLFVEDTETAQLYLEQSLQIFSQFPTNHPNYWIYLASQSYLFQKQEEYKKQIEKLQNSLQLIEKRSSSSNVSYMKLKMKFGQALMKADQFKEALNEFNNLEYLVENNLRESQEQQAIIQQADDQKMIIKLKLQKSLRQTQQKYMRQTAASQNLINSNTNLNESLNQISRAKLLSDHPAFANSNKRIQNSQQMLIEGNNQSQYNLTKINSVKKIKQVAHINQTQQTNIQPSDKKNNKLKLAPINKKFSENVPQKQSKITLGNFNSSAF